MHEILLSALLLAPSADRAELTGRVLAPGGKPVAGAHVIPPKRRGAHHGSAVTPINAAGRVPILITEADGSNFHVHGLALAPNLGWVLAATTVRGIGTGLIWVFSAVLLQILIPNRLRGRVFAFEFAALTLTQSASTLWAGVAYDNLGLTLSQVFISAGLAGTAITATWFLFYARVRRQPALVAEP